VSTFEEVSARIGSVEAATKSIAREIYEAAKAAGHEIWYIWGKGTSTEHATGRALDLMVRNEAAGDWVRDYIWAHRKRLRLRHIIWEQHITSTVVEPGVRRKMEDRGNPTANHFDHGHGWFFPGEYQPPVGAPSPAPAPPRTLVVDGKLGPLTISKWQRVMGTPVDGKIDKHGSLLIKAVQKVLRKVVPSLVVDGDPGPKTIEALQRYLGAPITRRLDSNTVKTLQRRLNENRF
jgi:hypothetical protein